MASKNKSAPVVHLVSSDEEPEINTEANRAAASSKSMKKIGDYFKPKRRKVVTVQLDSEDEPSKSKNVIETTGLKTPRDSASSANSYKSNRPSSPKEKSRSKLQERRLSLEKMRNEVLEQKARDRKSRLSLANFDKSESDGESSSEPKSNKAPVKDIRHYFHPDSPRHRNDADNIPSTSTDKRSKPASLNKNKVDVVDIESDSSSSSSSENDLNQPETEAQKAASRSKRQERKVLLEKMRQEVLEQKARERKSRLPIVDVPDPEEPEESSTEDDSEPTSAASTSGRSKNREENSTSTSPGRPRVVVQDVLHKKSERKRHHHKSMSSKTSSKKPRVEEPSTSSASRGVRSTLRSRDRQQLSPPPKKPANITFETDTDDDDSRSDKSHTSNEEVVRFRSNQVCVVCQSLKTTDKIVRQPWHYDVDWCKCSNCVPKKYMPNYHRICCREISFVVDKLKDELDIDNKKLKHACVTSHPEFERQVLLLGALKKINAVDRYQKPGGPKRSEAYIASLSYVQWTMGSVILGMLIPTCVRKRIMDFFPGQNLPVTYAVSKICSKAIHCKHSMAESFPASTL